MQLTDKETAAFKAIIDNALENMGGKEPASLHYDNFSWFTREDLSLRTSLNKNEASGIMSALADKGMIMDSGTGCATWYVTDKGIDLAQLLWGKEPTC